MNRAHQRAAIDAAFTEALATYQAKRAANVGLDSTDLSHEGSVALGKSLQTASLALRLELIDYAEYEAYLDRVTTIQSVSA